jgi:ferrous iron transport protein A
VAVVTLDQAPRRTPLVVRRPQLPTPRARRLAELGLRPGVVLTVLRRTAGGGRLVAIGDARVAVGRETARALDVSLSAPPAVQGQA